MLDARFSQSYFGPSLNTLQRGLPAIAGLLVLLLVSQCIRDVACQKIQLMWCVPICSCCAENTFSLFFVRTHCKKKTNSEGNRCCFVKHKRCVLRPVWRWWWKVPGVGFRSSIIHTSSLCLSSGVISYSVCQCEAAISRTCLALKQLSCLPVNEIGEPTEGGSAWQNFWVGQSDGIRSYQYRNR